VKLWDRATGQLVRTFEGHGAEVQSVAFSPGSPTEVRSPRPTENRLGSGIDQYLPLAASSSGADLATQNHARDFAAARPDFTRSRKRQSPHCQTCRFRFLLMAIWLGGAKARRSRSPIIL
jgi:WD40 repeat protein